MREGTSPPEAPRSGARSTTMAHRAFVVAAIAGLLHAAASGYWALGGTWLVETLGASLVALLDEWRWVLYPVAALKAAGAILPLVWAQRGWPRRWPARSACWLGGVVLIVWGGLNTVIGWLVLTEVIRPEGGYDRPGMIGHAALWDPLFLIWGLALLAGLVRTRRRPISP